MRRSIRHTKALGKNSLSHRCVQTENGSGSIPLPFLSFECLLYFFGEAVGDGLTLVEPFDFCLPFCAPWPRGVGLTFAFGVAEGVGAGLGLSVSVLFRNPIPGPVPAGVPLGP